MMNLGTVPDLVNKGIQKVKRKGKRILSEGGFVGNIKHNFRYMQLGMKEAAKEQKRARAESNIKNAKFWNPERGEKMEEEYKQLKKKGVY